MNNLFFERPILNSPLRTTRLPDFIVRIDDTCWVPGINHVGSYGRWAFVEFVDVYHMQHDFAKKVEAEFNKMMDAVTNGANDGDGEPIS